ncbi:tRNA (adenosine(37)-N6)-dimethylallyltransferase MiaA [Paenibacillus selenitireducens]|uniref:tRNA dimethylallyltransferase n=1 Tax=Paenibacillus selenitireducens TaxID=1324314 RepID=A0A1T2X4I6_9BACL|nr:tRNA (adenosine(37)-N6)-dimethylallyltransferase MiaA [Paenibacillus selenitireducens]OPA74804.1 tRNA (adenosine(37)-N6)-dimethylallyltransferase MiaA [Paenibacillus selenitireducens]
MLVLIGPTAVGKTALSLELAELFNCEIISGDSMQVYRHMDIGTAKLPLHEQKGIVHHMIDIHDPDEAFSVAEFQDRCKALAMEIEGRGKLPFIVGGTGLYVESVCYGFEFSETGADEVFRQEQVLFAEKHGAIALHDKLKAVDPVTADRLHPNDQRRIIRALEVYHLTGAPLSEQLAGQTKTSPYDLCIIGLTMERALLYQRIEQRIDEMLEEGLVLEVDRLLKKGFTRELVSMQGLGYKEIAAYLEGECSLDEAVTLLKRDTRRFAKRQLSWFRHMKEIHWVDVTQPENFVKNKQAIRDIIAGKFHIDLEYISKQSN